MRPVSFHILLVLYDRIIINKELSLSLFSLSFFEKGESRRNRGWKDGKEPKRGRETERKGKGKQNKEKVILYQLG